MHRIVSHLFQEYKKFLKRSIHTFPEDIVQPYHKIIDLVLKVTGLFFATTGACLILSSVHCYSMGATDFCASILTTTMTQAAPVSETTLDPLLMRWLWGAGHILIALFVSSVLIVRHLNETLPDHIYLRCFASSEERERRLPLEKKNHA